jgi:hypothetical protein
VAVVVLEEIGLAEDSPNMPLKVLEKIRSPWETEVCVLHYRACDMWLAGWRGDFAIL